MMLIFEDELRTPLVTASELAQAAIEITEVQWKLLRSELLRWRRQVLLLALLLVASTAIVLSCVYLLLLGVALAAADLAATSLAFSLFVVASISGAVGSIVAIFAWLWIRTLPSPFCHLQVQFLEDARWLKSRIAE